MELSRPISLSASPPMERFMRRPRGAGGSAPYARTPEPPTRRSAIQMARCPATYLLLGSTARYSVDGRKRRKPMSPTVDQLMQFGAVERGTCL